MIPEQIRDQIPDKSTVGFALALASQDDGAVMEFRWCNKAFTKATGFEASEIIGARASILIGPSMEQGKHLWIIEKLMNWEQFSITIRNNRKTGEQYSQQVSWTPLSDTMTKDRWWLCSLIGVDEKDAEIPPAEVAVSPLSESDLAAKYAEKICRLEKENARLHEIATSVAKASHEDPLTGLSNRRHFALELDTWIANLANGGCDFAVLYIDVDRFKFVNDTLGHEAGDRLLILVAKLLRRLTDASDLVARLGGDEFVVLKRLGDSALNISSLADDIVQDMKSTFRFEDKTTKCSVSIGVAIANSGMANPEQIVANADTALYHAKSHGKGRWSFFTEEMHAAAMITKQLASELLVACESHQFVPFLQPVIDTATGLISSAEVLVRWAHPTRGLLPPHAFLDTAADMGILQRIDEIVFGHLPDMLAQIDACGVGVPKLAINVSADRLADPSFIHDIKSSGIPPDRLIVEILESVFLERMGDVVHWTIDELDEMGITIAIDDFGTGHASVQGLLNINPSVLKIDRQFVQPIVEDEKSRDLVSAIIGIGKSLGMRIVAEGVESAEHAAFVGNLGSDYLQGHYFGKPMSVADLRDRLLETQGQFWSGKGAPDRAHLNGNAS